MRISATLLESFRYWSEIEDPETADKKEAELQASIRGEFTPSPAMRIGTAYHKLVERPQLALDGVYEYDGLRFDPPAIDTLHYALPVGLFEVKATRELIVDGCAVTLVTKCDHIAGASITEIKTTLGTFDAEKYLASYQWRVMVMLFDAMRVTYRVACLIEDADRFVLRSLESITVYPYPDLKADVMELMDAFIAYVRARGLQNYLLPREVSHV